VKAIPHITYDEPDREATRHRACALIAHLPSKARHPLGAITATSRVEQNLQHLRRNTIRSSSRCPRRCTYASPNP